jgi:phosphoribosylformimino-5-aminoimidazole carboxamide ribotide isomerase
MRIIPVIDVMSGVAVRAIAGRRAEYQPLVSRLTPSNNPRDVADAFRRHFRLTELYLADLDAITGAEPAWALFAELHHCGFRLWVDAGVRTMVDAVNLASAGVEIVVIGLETLHGPDELRAAVAALGAKRVAFSLDMMDGHLLGNSALGDCPESVADMAAACGVRRVILLDLARIGVASGTGTEVLLARLVNKYPYVEFVAGGGVRGQEDLKAIEAAGAAAALVASALHDGHLLIDVQTSVRFTHVAD